MRKRRAKLHGVTGGIMCVKMPPYPRHVLWRMGELNSVSLKTLIFSVDILDIEMDLEILGFIELFTRQQNESRTVLLRPQNLRSELRPTS
jgi:hypothetical protein